MKFMLYWKEQGTYIEDFPYQKAFDRWHSRMNDEDYVRITHLIHTIADDSIQIDTILLRPDEWKDSLYEPIFLACNGNRKGAMMFLELIIFKVLLEREDKWQFSLNIDHKKYIDRLIYTKKIM